MQTWLVVENDQGYGRIADVLETEDSLRVIKDKYSLPYPASRFSFIPLTEVLRVGCCE